jgi:2-C-methyl-D-erythritol 4-phosphate cytidylyltransferase / 2-C-methyl-D-erythritol 2,4-cyclodiphosphate synthase
VKIVAAILAAGKGERFGGEKTTATLGGKPVWKWSYDVFSTHPDIDLIVIVTAKQRLEIMRREAPDAVVVEGGDTRQSSSRAALDAIAQSHEATDVLLIHDAARPFVTHRIISDVIEGIRANGAAAAAIPVTDTIKSVSEEGVRTLRRDELVSMQTPQGATIALLEAAHASAFSVSTDEMALLEAIGVHPFIVAGDSRNFKITNPDDLGRAKAIIGSETRTGIGYDVHPFSSDPERTLWLGGVPFPDHPALEGHSDADALLHALTDAILGALGLGDIGQHFPNTDPEWKGKSSLHFLTHAAKLVATEGWRIVNVDMTCVAESPKIMKRAMEIRETISQALSVSIGRVSLKATTNERLGFIGRGEGIAAMAIATVTNAL